jgi:hypothetical protein
LRGCAGLGALELGVVDGLERAGADGPGAAGGDAVELDFATVAVLAPRPSPR